MLKDGIGGGVAIMSRTDFARACLLAADMGIDAGAAASGLAAPPEANDSSRGFRVEKKGDANES